VDEATKKSLEHNLELDMTPIIDIIFNLLIFFMIVTDLSQKDIVELTLPIAHMAEEDKADDEDDRLILNVDTKGQVLHRSKAISLDELSTVLKDQIRLYNVKMKDRGKTGEVEISPGVKASKLSVLLRADRDTPWQHVQWLMTVMAERKLYKLQFATKKFADSSYDAAQIKELGGVHQKSVDVTGG
jgi:biopolymer transport protein ExbD